MRKSVPGAKKKLSVRDEVEELLNRNVNDEENVPMIHHGVVSPYGGVGQPSKMTPSCVEEIIERVSNGEIITKICKDPHMPSANAVWRWIRTKPDFSALYYAAKKFATDVMAEEILAIADDGSQDSIVTTDRHGNERVEMNNEFVKRSEIRIKARQWLMERINSGKYNERVMMEQASVKSATPNMNATIKIMLPDNGRPITATLETTAEEV